MTPAFLAARRGERQGRRAGSFTHFGDGRHIARAAAGLGSAKQQGRNLMMIAQFFLLAFGFFLTMAAMLAAAPE
jgi:hypothetical protein